jgi:hypothetical protein
MKLPRVGLGSKTKDTELSAGRHYDVSCAQTTSVSFAFAHHRRPQLVYHQDKRCLRSVLL